MQASEAMLTRRSTRKFLKKQVEEEKLSAVLRAAQHAPSGGNSQNCHFYVIKDDKILQTLAAIVQEAFAKMELEENAYASKKNSVALSRKGNYVFHYAPPVFVIVTNRRDYPNAMADSACALENMMICANELSLGSCWINQLHWLEEDKSVRDYLFSLGIPKEASICGSLSLGYADTADGLPPRETKKITGNPITYI